MRTNLENSRVQSPKVFGMSLGSMDYTMTGTLILLPDGPGVYLLDAVGSNRVVRLPPNLYENQIVIANIGTSGTLNVTDSNGVAQVDVPAQNVGMFFASKRRWIWFQGPFIGSLGARVVVASGPILTTDTVVQTDQAGLIVLTLPSALSWLERHNNTPMVLSIFDISGNAAVNNVQLNTTGIETISGYASGVLKINSNFGGYRLQPKLNTAGGWIMV